ncbi:MAG: acyl--CoA ligase [candidate division Zixibacteria bacterium]|nr:acyl--CoA ligase [candidate division Zixibacteria bacterium]
MLLGDLLTRAAAAFPERKAVVHLDQSINYRDLALRSGVLAEHLKGIDLPPGSRIALYLENSIDYVAACFAVLNAGHVVVPIDTSLNHEKLNFILNDCQAQVLIVHARHQRMLAKLWELKPSLVRVISDKQLKFRPDQIVCDTFNEIANTAVGSDIEKSDAPATDLPGWDDANAAPRDLAAIFYTSGSTGEAKGVMLSHRNLISNTIGTVEYLKLTEKDSVLVILPFYYIYGNSLMLGHMSVGGALVIDNRFMYPEIVLDTMEAENVTGFSGVPSNFMILLNTSSFAERKLESLRYFTQAGGSLAPELIKRLYDAFSHKEIYIMYGQTEASPRITWLPPERLIEKLGTVGIEVPGLLVRIIKENGEEAVVDEEGEIVVGGDSVMMGYWNQPDEQKEVLKDGWLYTGDLAKRDDDGFIRIVGRKKEIIKSGGNRVSAKEIEECLLTCEAIHEAAVFGVPDDLLGEAIKAVVVPRNGCDIELQQIRQHCRRTLSEHKIPKLIEIAESLPKYKSGKVNKGVLARAGQSDAAPSD